MPATHPIAKRQRERQKSAQRHPIRVSVLSSAGRAGTVTNAVTYDAPEDHVKYPRGEGEEHALQRGERDEQRSRSCASGAKAVTEAKEADDDRDA
jgi:hypothetical protein